MVKKQSSEYTEGLAAKKTSGISKPNTTTLKKTPKGANLEMKAVPKPLPSVTPSPRATRTFRVYDRNTLLGEDPSPVSLANKLKPNTNYTNLKIAAVEDGLQSILVPVPAFKTLDNTVHVTGVTVSPKVFSMKPNETVNVQVTISPSNATNKSFTVSGVNSKVATYKIVGNSIQFKGLADGSFTATVTTAEGNKTATIAVTVSTRDIHVTGISLPHTNYTGAVGTTLPAIIPIIKPETATNKGYSVKSSDPTKVKVNSDNSLSLIAEVNKQPIVFTTTDGGFTATAYVTVTKGIPVTGIALPQTNYAGKVGDTLPAIKPIIKPANATVTTYSVKSSDPTKVKVNSDNSLSLLAEVNRQPIVFTTTDGGFTATAYVTVTAGTPVIKPTGIEITPNPLIFPKGSQGAATISITPDNTSNHEAKVGSVNGEGVSAEYKWRQIVVNGTKAGKGAVEVVAAGDERVKTTLNVEVTDVDNTKVTRLVVDPTSVDLDILKSVNTHQGTYDLRTSESFITVSIAPENATNKGFTVESTEPDTMQLDITEGIGFTITALKATKAEGGATLTVTSTDNPDAKAFVKVNIKEIAIPDIEDILLYPDALTVKVGEEKDTTVQLKPDEGRNYYQIKNVTSDKPEVSTPRFLPQATAIVAEGHKEGTAKLTVEAWNPNVPDKVVKKVLTVTVTK